MKKLLLNMKRAKLCFILLFPCSLSLTPAFSQTITTVAGNYALGNGYSGDGGPATSAEFDRTDGVAFDGSGNMYISDADNNVIRKVNTSGTISTFVGNGYNKETGNGGYSGDGGAATNAELYLPNKIAFDASGNLYFTDFGNYVIRKVSTSGTITTVVGNHVGGYSGDGGPASAAELNGPIALAFDHSGNLYIPDLLNQVIRKVNTSGMISTVAGNQSLGAGFSGDGGPATSGQFNYPYGIAVDASGNLYVADYYNNVVRKVNTSGTISTEAGNHAFGNGYSGDSGPATSAELYEPSGVGVDASGHLFIADEGNQVVRMVSVSGKISTVAGNNSLGGGHSGDGGPATSAQLNDPYGFAWDASGNLYIADGGNNEIRKVTGLFTGVSELSVVSNQLSVYPNPNNGKFTIQLSGVSSQGSVVVYNILGQPVYSKYSIPNTQYQIDLGSQPGGIYFVKVIDNNNQTIGVNKVVVQ